MICNYLYKWPTWRDYPMQVQQGGRRRYKMSPASQDMSVKSSLENKEWKMSEKWQEKWWESYQLGRNWVSCREKRFPFETTYSRRFPLENCLNISRGDNITILRGNILLSPSRARSKKVKIIHTKRSSTGHFNSNATTIQYIFRILMQPSCQPQETHRPRSIWHSCWDERPEQCAHQERANLPKPSDVANIIEQLHIGGYFKFPNPTAFVISVWHETECLLRRSHEHLPLERQNICKILTIEE